VITDDPNEYTCCDIMSHPAMPDSSLLPATTTTHFDRCDGQPESWKSMSL
jgi:hypothetical protein